MAQVQCPMCAEDVASPAALIAPGTPACAHGVCASCWSRFLGAKFEQKGGFTSCYDGKLMCVAGAPACKTVITMAFARAHCSPATAQLIDTALSTVPQGARANLPAEQLTLDDFNYAYNKDGMLRLKTTGGKFVFVNQQHYELLGDVVTLHIQRVLRSTYGLTELFLPFVKAAGEPQGVDSYLGADKDKAAALATAHAAAAAAPAPAVAAGAAAAGGAAAAAAPALAAAAAGAGAGAAAAAAAASDVKAGAAAAAVPAAGGDAAPTNRPYNNIFCSADALYCDTLLVLIQGSGAVRPGMWARACCINDSLAIGTIFPYLEAAQKRGWGTVVLNPNQNRVKKTPAEQAEWKAARLAERAAHKARTGKELPADDETKWNYQLASQWNPIPEHDTPRAHTLYVWDRIISASKAKHVLIVAHSAGGHCTLSLLQLRTANVLPRLRAVAFTDSVHSVPDDATRPVRQFMMAHCVNYVQSDEPLDTPCARDDDTDGCPCVSAGHPKHEFTSGTAFPSVFKFLDKHLAAAKAKAAAK